MASSSPTQSTRSGGRKRPLCTGPSPCSTPWLLTPWSWWPVDHLWNCHDSHVKSGQNDHSLANKGQPDAPWVENPLQAETPRSSTSPSLRFAVPVMPTVVWNTHWPLSVVLKDTFPPDLTPSYEKRSGSGLKETSTRDLKIPSLPNQDSTESKAVFCFFSFSQFP